jgi:hypothetical protein
VVNAAASVAPGVGVVGVVVVGGVVELRSVLRPPVDLLVALSFVVLMMQPTVGAEGSFIIILLLHNNSAVSRRA